MAEPGSVAPVAGRVAVLVTAAEAHPVLERAFPGAESKIMAGFRVFDLKSRLRLAERLAAGRQIAPAPLVAEIVAAHHEAIGQARRLIHVESQYFRVEMV